LADRDRSGVINPAFAPVARAGDPMVVVDRGRSGTAWRRRARSSGLTVLGLGLAVLVWAAAAGWGSGSGGFQLVPTPAATFAALARLLRSPDFLADLAASLQRIGIGFALSLAAGLLLGAAIGVSRSLSSLLGGIIDALKYTPVTTFIPLTILWFGVGDLQKVVVLGLGTAPYLAAMVADAIRATRTEYVDGARTLGAGAVTIVWRVVVPSAAPQVWQAARLSFAIAWTYLVTAELVGANQGLGRFLVLSERFVHIEDMFAATIVIGFVGFVSDIAFRLVHRRLFPWVLHSTEQGRGGG
jgi:NitT/TauT family transport system permease protein